MIIGSFLKLEESWLNSDDFFHRMRDNFMLIYKNDAKTSFGQSLAQILTKIMENGLLMSTTEASHQGLIKTSMI